MINLLLELAIDDYAELEVIYENIPYTFSSTPYDEQEIW